jgi:hypothetical protein
VLVGTENSEQIDIDSYMLAPDTLVLTWSAPSEPADMYRIYRATEPHFDPRPHLLLTEVNQEFYKAYLDSAAENPDLNYYFRVSWVSTEGAESPGSQPAGATDVLITIP